MMSARAGTSVKEEDKVGQAQAQARKCTRMAGCAFFVKLHNRIGMLFYSHFWLRPVFCPGPCLHGREMGGYYWNAPCE